MPAILKAKEMGLCVAVADMDERAPGVVHADKFYKVSTIDADGVVEAALDFNPDGVMTLATDMPIRSVAAVARRLGLPAVSPEVAVNATDKIEMIRCFAKSGVPHPWFEIISSEKELEELVKNRNTPYIMKPNDSSGSKGVVLVENKEDAKTAFLYSKSVSGQGLVLVEEYMQGPEVSVEGITINGKTYILAVTDKLTSGAPFFVEMGHSQPSGLPESVIDEIKNVAADAIKAVGIDNSPSHVEIIVTRQGPKLVELGARLGGDCITTHLVPLSTGVDMVEACILLALGKVPDITVKYNKGAAIRYAKSQCGVLLNICGIADAAKEAGVLHVEIVKKTGETVNPVQASGDRIGYVIAQSENASDAVKACGRALEKIKFTVG